MKPLCTALLALGITFGTSAQTPLTEAVDFTVTDLNGGTHTLSDYLDAGLYVCIDFFVYWCGSCAAHAPHFSEAYHMYGCNDGDVIFLSIEYEGTWNQAHDFETANAGPNPAPTISGAEGGGLAVHDDYSIQSVPTFILIDPDGNIVEQNISPMNADILDEVLQSYGLTQMTCGLPLSSEENDIVSLDVWPNPAADALQVEACVGTELTLIDLVGREVVRTIALHNRTFLDLTMVPGGTYLLRAQNEHATETRKVIVRH